ncbi:MAG: ABC transporter ATP-binding protein [Pseudomonadales bacterium]
MVKVEQLSKHFGQFKAVDKLSFEVSPGEVLGFLGPNGAGKSTTMKMITGFIAPTAGSIMVGGHDVSREPVKAKSLIGYLPEGAPAYADMTPAQFLKFAASIRKLGSASNARIDQVVEQLMLKDVLHKPIDTLSKGFKRRVGIAQAILHDPKVLILDEPTDGLDPIQKHEVRSLITNLAEDKTVIVSTHILEEVNAVCSRAIIIADGQVVADAEPGELEAQSEYHGAVTLKLSGDTDPRSELQALPSVFRVETYADDDRRVTAIPNADSHLYTDIQALAKQKQWDVEEMFAERGRLEDVFRRLVDSHASQSKKIGSAS